MIKFDFWYNNCRADVSGITVCFYPDICEYRGNLYDISGRCIGDFTALDSVEVEHYFPGIFAD